MIKYYLVDMAFLNDDTIMILNLAMLIIINLINMIIIDLAIMMNRVAMVRIMADWMVAPWSDQLLQEAGFKRTMQSSMIKYSEIKFTQCYTVSVHSDMEWNIAYNATQQKQKAMQSNAIQWSAFQLVALWKFAIAMYKIFKEQKQEKGLRSGEVVGGNDKLAVWLISTIHTAAVLFATALLLLFAGKEYQRVFLLLAAALPELYVPSLEIHSLL